MAVLFLSGIFVGICIGILLMCLVIISKDKEDKNGF